MEKQAITPKKKKQRRFMLVLPLLVLPFITLIFWVLGGGSNTDSQGAPQQAGFNLNLPDAHLKEDKPMNKMSYYNQARKDSLKFRELVKNDPNYHTETPSESETVGIFDTGNEIQGVNTSLYTNPNASQTERIYQKLEALNRELNRPVPSDSVAETYAQAQTPIVAGNTVEGDAGDIDRLHRMMEMMNEPPGEDPEMQQINGMLEKILDIQYPDRVREKNRQLDSQRREGLLNVSSLKQEDNISLLRASDTGFSLSNGFYSLEEDPGSTIPANAIEAVIHETQTLVNGSTLKLRLTQEVTIAGTVIPKDSFVFGTATLSGERLGITINSIRYQQSLFPVELTVYDMDGLSGIYIPGAITRDVAKQSASRSAQSLGMGSLDPSLAAQAASAGIEAVGSLVSKKIKLVKVTVKAGYRVLLYDEKQKHVN